MAGKKNLGENSKKASGNAQKAEAAAAKAAAAQAQADAATAADWGKGAKSSAKKYVSPPFSDITPELS
jgi:septal ring factor EnvC (AmiA/AmiB activator)